MNRASKTKPSGFSQADLAAIDNPEMTEEELAALRRAEEVLPADLLANLRRGRGAQKAPTKLAVSIRLSPDVVAYYKSQGEKWQARIDADLRKLVGRRRKAS